MFYTGDRQYRGWVNVKMLAALRWQFLYLIPNNNTQNKPNIIKLIFKKFCVGWNTDETFQIKILCFRSTKRRMKINTEQSLISPFKISEKEEKSKCSPDELSFLLTITIQHHPHLLHLLQISCEPASVKPSQGTFSQQSFEELWSRCCVLMGLFFSPHLRQNLNLRHLL